MTFKVFIEHNSGEYADMFRENGWQVVLDLHEADLLQLEGGADVTPQLYQEEQHPTTWSSEETDKYTHSLYTQAQVLGIPIAGICRGSQFLCVMGGGKLWQDVDGHATGYGHDLIDLESKIIIKDCSSTHHQQHRPASNAIIIATAYPQPSKEKHHMQQQVGSAGAQSEKSYLTGFSPNDYNLDNDVEAFYYPHINALGYQPHPEFFNADHPCQKYYFDIIAKYLKLKA